jgi:putative membrane protein insertion efficiency factor
MPISDAAAANITRVKSGARRRLFDIPPVPRLALNPASSQFCWRECMRIAHVAKAGGITPLLRSAAHILIRFYQLTLSALVGRWCRHLPSCSSYMDEAIQKHGAWPGGWMGLARLCRCRPGGTSGYDPVPSRLATSASALTPWRYGQWRGPLVCEPTEERESAGL